MNPAVQAPNLTVTGSASATVSSKPILALHQKYQQNAGIFPSTMQKNFHMTASIGNAWSLLDEAAARIEAKNALASQRQHVSTSITNQSNKNIDDHAHPQQNLNVNHSGKHHTEHNIVNQGNENGMQGGMLTMINHQQTASLPKMRNQNGDGNPSVKLTMNAPLAGIDNSSKIAQSVGSVYATANPAFNNSKHGRPQSERSSGEVKISKAPMGTPAPSPPLMSTSPAGMNVHLSNAQLSKALTSTDTLSASEDDYSTRASPADVLELNKHTSEVFMCAWNPIHTNLIATGSGDASARIWQMAGPDAKTGCDQSRLLQHGNPNDRNKDVTTLEWSSDGNLLATGSYDGVARVWSRAGLLLHTLRSHRGPIFSLKWNKQGNFLLSGSYDKSTIVWDISGETGYVKQQFNHHIAPALDVDWKDNSTFASCSTDKTVHICRVGSPHPLQTYTGHTDEVNAVKWDPSGTLLASCSDDCTAKVWDVSRGVNESLYDFKSHQMEIYTVKWSSTGQGSDNPSKPLMLATASFDGSVRLWNVQDGTCIRVLSRHKDSVYSVSFSPSGDYLASGSLAGQLYVWNVRDGRVIKSFRGTGDIFEVAWNVEETRIAACFSSNVVSVIDFKK